MDQKEFNRLTHTCDSILQKFSSDNAIVAVPWLHVLNGHPNSIQQYRFAFHKRSFLAAAGSFIKNLGYIFLKLVQSIVEFRSNRISKEPFKADVLFISHLVGLTAIRRESDFYFGTLPMHLTNATGRSAIIGLIDHTPSQKSIVIRSKIEEGETRRIVFLKTISFSKEISFAFQCLSSFLKLIQAGMHATNKEEKNIFQEAALHAMGRETLAALRIQEQISQSLKQTQATTLVITWEGRSWERLAIHAAKNVEQSVRCLAYQHTVLMASSHALTKGLGKQYDPDLIFTIGEKTADILRSSNEFQHTNVISYGSYRLAVTQKENITKTGNASQCLVTPEGIETECVLLFDLAIALAEEQPGINFIFRTHPVLPYDMLAKKYNRFAELPNNCIISDRKDINEDFKRCNLLLYRGSSVSIYGAMQGLRPLYYSIPGEISIDPLYQLGEWRMVIQNSNDFAEAIKTHNETSAEKRNDMCRVTRSFCEDYLKMPDENIFYQTIL